MAQTSPFLLVKRIESQLSSQLSYIDVVELATKERKIIAHLRRDMADARLDVRDYELSETRQEQLANAKAAKTRLRTVSAGILAASESNLFGAADVAQLTAQIEQTITNLQ